MGLSGGNEASPPVAGLALPGAASEASVSPLPVGAAAWWEHGAGSLWPVAASSFRKPRKNEITLGAAAD